MIISSGPKVFVQIETKEGTIVRSTLSLSDTFSWAFINQFPLDPIVSWLEAYSLRQHTHLPPLFDLNSFSPFQKSVLKQLSQIPIGTTQSYSQIAQAIGNPRSARAVGGACNRNPFPLFFPCHRVIQKGNTIGGFAVDLEIKRRLLEFEGRSFPLPS